MSYESLEESVGRIPGYEPFNPGAPKTSRNSSILTMAAKLRAVATLEHTTKLEEIKQEFITKANEAATKQEFFIYLYPEKWTKRLIKDFIDWATSEGFRCTQSTPRQYEQPDIKVSWE